MTEDISISKISFVGNKNTNKHNKNVRLYFRNGFDENDLLTIIDLQTRRKTSDVKVYKFKNGNNFGYFTNHKIFSDHEGKYAILRPLNMQEAIEVKMNLRNLEGCQIPKYLISSNKATKHSLLVYIINTTFLDLGLKETVS